MNLQKVKFHTVIAEIFVRVKILYSSAPELSYAINFRTATAMSHTLVCVHSFHMLLNFVLSAKSTKYTKLNRVRKFLQLQYSLTRHFAQMNFVSIFSHNTVVLVPDLANQEWPLKCILPGRNARGSLVAD